MIDHEVKNSFKGRDFLCLADYTKEEINVLLETAKELKYLQQNRIPHPYLQGKTLGMIFYKSSSRTRVSFEAGMAHLGGYPMFLSSRDLQIGRGEPLKDTARVLSRYLDAIMIRTFEHEIVEELAYWADIPIINGLTDLLHPTQVLADLLTIMENRGKLEGLKLTYIGDGNNMAHSLLIGCAKMGMDITVASPAEYQPQQEIVTKAQGFAELSGSKIQVITDPIIAAKGADVLYTDVWASMGQEAEFHERKSAFKGYQINDDTLKIANPDCMVLHCLPAHRGEEITEEVLEGPQSFVFDEAENRMHAHKAILALLV